MIYLDNAATSWPKPPEVQQALGEVLQQYGANPGRGGHSFSLKTARMVLAAREELAAFFRSRQFERWIYTSGATESANLALFGLLQPGDHVIVSQHEHNALARPLQQLSRQGIAVSFVSGTDSELLHCDQLQQLIRPETKLVVVGHASNVTGVVQPLGPISDWCRKSGILLLVDAAQTAGLLPIDVTAGIDLLVVPGHKSLYGPPGIGALYVDSRVDLRPSRFGGTGTQSESLEQPTVWPDRMESGTLNTPGIYGLRAGIRFVQSIGQEALYRQELAIAEQLARGLRAIPGMTVYGWSGGCQVPVVACNLSGVDSSQLAQILDSSYQIAARAGLHCAPLAHRTLGTLGQGILRFSIGYYNTSEEIAQVLAAMREISLELR